MILPQYGIAQPYWLSSPTIDTADVGTPETLPDLNRQKVDPDGFFPVPYNC